MVIYADILLAVNWWIDFLLLLGVRRALGGGVKNWRLALAALIGAVSSFVLFLPPLSPPPSSGFAAAAGFSAFPSAVLARFT